MYMMCTSSQIILKSYVVDLGLLTCLKLVKTHPERREKGKG